MSSSKRAGPEGGSGGGGEKPSGPTFMAESAKTRYSTPNEQSVAGRSAAVFVAVKWYIGAAPSKENPLLQRTSYAKNAYLIIGLYLFNGQLMVKMRWFGEGCEKIQYTQAFTNLSGLARLKTNGSGQFLMGQK